MLITLPAASLIQVESEAFNKDNKRRKSTVFPRSFPENSFSDVRDAIGIEMLIGSVFPLRQEIPSVTFCLIQQVFSILMFNEWKIK